MLEVLDLKVSYGAIRALDGLSFSVPAGAIVALLGANGSGKSTAIRTITGLAVPQGGRIVFAGREIQGLPPHEIIRAGLAVVPEGRRIFTNLTVYDNLLLGAYRRRDKEALARDLAGLFDTFPRLAERRHQAAGTLSGGEQQMLALGRALMSRPRLLLLDEPSLGLAPRIVQLVMENISKINERFKNSILLVEQNFEQVKRVAQKIMVIKLGQIVFSGVLDPSMDKRELWKYF